MDLGIELRLRLSQLPDQLHLAAPSLRRQLHRMLQHAVLLTVAGGMQMRLSLMQRSDHGSIRSIRSQCDHEVLPQIRTDMPSLIKAERAKPRQHQERDTAGNDGRSPQP